MSSFYTRRSLTRNPILYTKVIKKIFLCVDNPMNVRGNRLPFIQELSQPKFQSGYDQTLNLTGPFIDFCNLCIPKITFNR